MQHTANLSCPIAALPSSCTYTLYMVILLLRILPGCHVLQLSKHSHSQRIHVPWCLQVPLAICSVVLSKSLVPCMLVTGHTVQLHAMLLLQSPADFAFLTVAQGTCPPCSTMHAQCHASHATCLLQNATHRSHCIQLCQPGLGLLPHVWAGLGRGWGSHCYLSLPIRFLRHNVLPDAEEGHPAAAAHAARPQAGSSAAHLASKLSSSPLCHWLALLDSSRAMQHVYLHLECLLAYLACHCCSCFVG